MIIVRHYGLLEPDNWGDDCQAQMLLMNSLWNKLVEIERADREKYKSLMSEDPAVAQFEFQLNALDEEIKELKQERKKLRQASRSKKVDDGFLKERIKLLSDEAKEIRPKLKELRAAAREAAKPILDKLYAERTEAVKAARQEMNWGGTVERERVLRIRELKEERKRLKQILETAI